jgi:cyanate lyase
MALFLAFRYDAIRCAPDGGRQILHLLPAQPPDLNRNRAVTVEMIKTIFHEITYVYGDTIKELIHEKFGDGIMSAIDFDLHVDKVPDPKGDRVRVTMSGKFLPYKQW